MFGLLLYQNFHRDLSSLVTLIANSNVNGCSSKYNLSNISKPSTMDNYDDVDDSEEVYIDYNYYKDDGVGLESFYIYDYYTFLNHFYGTLLKKATNQQNFGTLYYLPILKLYFLQLTVLL